MKTMNVNGFERVVLSRPAFDKRHPEPSKNYGIGSSMLYFILRGENGAVSFSVMTGWYLPHLREEHKAKGYGNEPLPADLSYHSPVQTADWQEPRDCEYIEGGKCYGDGSTLNADPVFERWVAEGDDGLWGALEEYYKETFEEQE